MRVFLTILGAIVGLSLASGSHELFGVALGAFAGFAAGELGALRTKLRALEGELAELRKSTAQRFEAVVRPRRGDEADVRSPDGAGGPQHAPHPARSTSTQPNAGAWEPYGVPPPAGAMSRAGMPGGRADTSTGARSESANTAQSVLPGAAPESPRGAGGAKAANLGEGIEVTQASAAPGGGPPVSADGMPPPISTGRTGAVGARGGVS